MKKHPKKLRLSKETVRHLEEAKGGDFFTFICPMHPETAAFTNCDNCTYAGCGRGLV